MAQRTSGYERRPADLYETRAEALADLLAVWRVVGPVLEPACGSGNIVRFLRSRGVACTGTDINDYGTEAQSGQGDFLRMRSASGFATIFTNPPFGPRGTLATAFVEHALRLMEPARGQVIMLLPSDFDHARGRRHIFAEHGAFAARIALHRRPRWFDNDNGSSPSTNSCWFAWDWMNAGSPRLIYAEAAT